MIRPETLELILLGNLPPRELERLSPEVENDPSLEQVASQTGERDELLNLLRTRIQSDTLDPDERVESLKTRLRELRQMLPREIRFPFLAPPQAEDEIGRLGIYRIRELLGEGGMGYVFLAEDPSLNRTVALKVMKPTIAALPDHRERFLREARNAAAVENDRVVPIYHIGEQGGVPFFAMPNLKGESLSSRLNREAKLPWGELLRIGREIAEGLAAAHEKGMIHRDVQPGNVWLEAPHDRVKLLDFGLSRNTSAEVHLTQPGLMMGTPAFMAPEQARNREVDSRADLFSLGILLYRMGTGRSPFDGTDLISTLISVAVDEPTPPDLPAPLSKLILKLLSKKAEDRPASALEVAKSLAQIEADPSGSVVPAPATRPSARGRFRIAIALMLLLVMGGFGAYQIILKTENGTLIVDVSDPEVEARLKDGEVKLYDAKGVLKYTLKPSETNKKLPAGQYKISVSGIDGLRLDTEEFVIRNGDSVIVRVALEAPAMAKKEEPKKVEPKKQPAKADPDPAREPKIDKIDPVRAARGVAEWAILNKGKVVIEVKGQTTEVSLRSKLPDEAFQIRTLKYPESASFFNETLRSIASLDRLDRLEFTPYHAPNEDFLNLVIIKHELNPLIFEIAFLNTPPVSQAPSGSRTGGPGFGEGPVSGFGGSGFGSRSTQLSSSLLTTLKKFTALKKLEFEDAQFDGNLFQSFKEFRELTELRLSNCRLRDDWMYDLRGLKVRILQLDRNPSLTDECSVELLRKTELVELNLRKTGFTATGIQNLSKGLPKCNILSDHGTFVGGKQIAKTPIPPPEAARIVLKWVMENGGGITLSQDGLRQQLAEGYKLSPADVRLVSITFPNVVDPPEAIVDALESLDPVERFEFTTYASLYVWFRGKTQSIPAELRFTKCRIVGSSRGSLFDGKTSSQLKNFVFDQCEFLTSKGAPSGANFLKTLPPLEVLALSDCNLQNAQIPILRDVKTKVLMLAGNDSLTDECIPDLVKMSELKVLNVNATRITPAGLERIRKELPNCKIDGGAATSEPVPPAPKNSVLPKGEADRLVAEWVVRDGGSVVIDINGAKTEVNAKEKLPQGVFSLTTIRFASGTSTILQTPQMAALRQLVGVQRIEMSWNQAIFLLVEQAAIPEINSSLKELVISGDLPFGQIPLRIDPFKNLSQLTFEGTTFTTETFAVMKKLPAVKTIRLLNCRLYENWLADFRDAKPEVLDLTGCSRVNDAAIPELLKKVELKQLILKETDVTLDGLRKLVEGLPKTTVLCDYGLAKEGKWLVGNEFRPQDAQRIVAQWVLDNRGEVRAASRSGQPQAVATLKANDQFKGYEKMRVTHLRLPLFDRLPDDVERALPCLDPVPQFQFASVANFKQVAKGTLKSQLTQVDFSHCVIGSKRDTTAIDWKDYPLLKELQFSSCRFEDAEAASAILKRLPPLKSLTIRDSNFTLDWLRRFQHIQVDKLVLLGIAELDDSWMPELTKMNGLKELHVPRSHLTETGVKRLSVGLPDCRIFSNYGTHERGQSTKSSPLPSQPIAVNRIGGWLTANEGSLTVLYEGSPTPENFKLTQQNRTEVFRVVSMTLPTNARNPQQLYLEFATLAPFDLLKLNYDHVKYAGHLPEIPPSLWLLPSELEITNGKFTHNIFSQFRDFSRLQNLRLVKCSFAADELPDGLADCPPLKSLALIECGVANNWIKRLQKVRIESLDLRNNPGITDEAINDLLKLTELKELNVKGTKLTHEGVEALQTGLPNCRIVHDGGTIEPKK